MELGLVMKGRFDLTILRGAGGFFTKIQELGEKQLWISEIVNFNESDYQRLLRSKNISRFFEISRDKQKVAFIGGLYGGGCFGSKPKIIDPEKINKSNTISDTKVHPANLFKPEKETEKEKTVNISIQTDEKTEEILKLSSIISDDLENFYIDVKTVSKLQQFPYFNSKNPEHGLQNILNRLKLQQVQKNFSNKKGLADLSSILKELLIFSLTKKATEKIQVPLETLNEIEKIQLWLKDFNNLSNSLIPFCNFQAIFELLKIKDESFSDFKGLFSESTLSENSIKKLSPSLEDSICVSSIKFFLVKHLALKKVLKPEPIEVIFTVFFTSLANSNYFQIFEGFQSCFTLFKAKVITADYLLKHFLNFSALIENSDRLIRGLSAILLKKLSNYPSSAVGSGCQGLIQQFYDQEEDFSIKSETLAKPSKTLAKTFTSNMDFHSLRLLFTRPEELKAMKNHLEEKNFVEICGKPTCGKTCLALQYSKIFRNDYDVLWMVNSEQPEKDLDELAEVLGCPSGSLKTLMDKLRRNDGLRILMVFDNAFDLGLINEFMIKSKTVHFIVVTGKNVWKNSVNLDHGYEQLVQQYTKLVFFFNKKNEKDSKINENLKNNLLAYSLALNLISFETLEGLIDQNLEFRVLINSMITEYYSSSHNSLKYLLSIMSYLNPVNIPESLLYQVFIKKFPNSDWKKIRSELINNGLVLLSTFKETYWTIHEEVSIALCNLPKDPSLFKDLLDFFWLNFAQTSQETFHPLTFQVLSFFYFSDSSKLSIKTSVALVKNLLKINFNQKIISEILEILDENIHELTKTDKSKDSLDLFITLSNFSLQVKNEDRSYRLYSDYLQEFEALSSEYPEDFLQSLVEFSYLAEKMQDPEASHQYFDKALKDPRFDSCLNLVKVYERYSKSLISSLKFLEAETVLQAGIEKFAISSQETLASLNNTLGFLYFLQEKFSESQTALFKSKTMLESLKKTDSLEFLSVLELLSEVLSEEESRQGILEQALQICWDLYPPTHPELVFIASQLAFLHYKQTGRKSSDYFSYYSLFTSHHKDQTSLGPSLAELDFHSHYSTPYDYKRGIQLIQKGLQTFADLSNNP